MKTLPLNFAFAMTFPKISPKIKTMIPEVKAISIDSLTGAQKLSAIVLYYSPLNPYFLKTSNDSLLFRYS